MSLPAPDICFYLAEMLLNVILAPSEHLNE